MTLPTPEDVGFGKIITTETVHSGSLTSFIVEVEKSDLLNSTTVLQAILEALSHINKRQTRKVELTIVADSNYQIERMSKKYVAVMDKSGRAKQ